MRRDIAVPTIGDRVVPRKLAKRIDLSCPGSLPPLPALIVNGIVKALGYVSNKYHDLVRCSQQFYRI